MTYHEFILFGAEKLKTANIQCADPKLHMCQIIEAVSQIPLSVIYSHWNEPMPEEWKLPCESFILKRIQGIPFQYLLGFEWFWDSKFLVGEGVLIPRPETELIVDTLLKEKGEKERVAELGAGSGNIGISMLREKKSWSWFAFEFSPDSIHFLKRNKKNLLSEDAEYFIEEGDFFETAKKYAPYDWVVSNPPYLSDEDFISIPKEVQHEPQLALSGGKNGLQVISKLLTEARNILKPSGKILFEMGYSQSVAVKKMAEALSYKNISILNDLRGVPRVLVAEVDAWMH